MFSTKNKLSSTIEKIMTLALFITVHFSAMIYLSRRIEFYWERYKCTPLAPPTSKVAIFVSKVGAATPCILAGTHNHSADMPVNRFFAWQMKADYHVWQSLCSFCSPKMVQIKINTYFSYQFSVLKCGRFVYFIGRVSIENFDQI